MKWLLLVVVLAAVAVAVLIIEMRRSAHLRRQFGPEYERAIDRHGDRRAAESDLRERLARRRSVEVRDLTVEDRDRYVARWRAVQSAFVDDPGAAAAEAATLVEQVMDDRGYLRSGDGPDEGDGVRDRYELVAVDHPALVEQYRSAGAVGTSIDELREVFLHHRELFTALVQDSSSEHAEGVSS